jgi:hypothetical protein
MRMAGSSSTLMRMGMRIGGSSSALTTICGRGSTLMKSGGRSSTLMLVSARIGRSSSSTLALLVRLALTFQDLIETGRGSRSSSADIAMILITRQLVFCDYGGNSGAPVTTGDHIRHPQVGFGEFCFTSMSVRCGPPAS